MLTILPLDPHSAGAQALLAAADAYSRSLYPPESNHLDHAEELAKPHVLFVGAYTAANDLLGCGAVKIMEEYGEIKRLFVWPHARGQGVAGQIMAVLEAHLRGAGIPCARLETGVRQTEAIALYAKLGYTERAPFGAYTADPLSIFMEKQLSE